MVNRNHKRSSFKSRNFLILPQWAAILPDICFCSSLNALIFIFSMHFPVLNTSLLWILERFQLPYHLWLICLLGKRCPLYMCKRWKTDIYIKKGGMQQTTPNCSPVSIHVAISPVMGLFSGQCGVWAKCQRFFREL